MAVAVATKTVAGRWFGRGAAEADADAAAAAAAAAVVAAAGRATSSLKDEGWKFFLHLLLHRSGMVLPFRTTTHACYYGPPRNII